MRKPQTGNLPHSGEELPTLIAILSWAIALYQAWSIGANDETTAPVVSGKALSINQAVIAGSIIGILGAVFLGSSVQGTIGTGFLNKPLTEDYALVILLSASLWLTFVSYLGLSVSTTHSTIGALLGLGIVIAGLGDVNWQTIGSIIIGWLISMPAGFLLTYLGTKAMSTLKAKSGKPQEFDQTCTRLLILSTALLQFSRWGNDVGNAAGVMYALFDPVVTRFICALAMCFGLIVLGRIVIGNVGERMVRLTPSAALMSQIVATPLIFAFAFLGIPLSGTHVMIASILGGGVALKAKIDTKLVRNFAVAWALSFLVPALIAATFTAIGSASGFLSFK
jgi:PiT family inorganic phosphate transporter